MVVSGIGPTPARVALVGKAPGRAEVAAGEPFVGWHGQLTDEMLWRFAHLGRDECWLTNALSAFVGDRAPTASELAADTPRLHAELTAADPEVVVTLGHTAGRLFLPGLNLEAHHGQVVAAGPWLVLPTFLVGAQNPDALAGFVDDLRALRRWLDGDLSVARPVDPLPDPRYQLVLRHLPPDWGPVVAVDTEGSQERPWGLSYSVQPGVGYVVKADATVALRAFQARLEATQPLVVLHNALHDLGVLRALGIEGYRYTDTMMLSYLLQREPQGLKPLALRRGGMAMSDYGDMVSPAQDAMAEAALWGLLAAAPWRWVPTRLKTRLRWDRKNTPLRQAVARCLRSAEPYRLWTKQQPPIHAAALRTGQPCPREATLDDIPQGHAVGYAGRDADATLRVYPSLAHDVAAEGLQDVLEADLAVVPMVERMQQVGLHCDRDHFVRLGPWLLEERQVRIDALADLTGVRLNPDSGDQVAELLYGTLGLPAPRRKRGKRPTTDKKALGALEGRHPAVGLVLEARQCTKLRSTYVLRLLQMLDPEDRLHPHFRLTRVVTGRLAAHSPNVLAIPKHTAMGKMVRAGFTAPPGRLIGSWDLSQIEMRWLALESQDPALLRIFREGVVDMHTDTAHRVLGGPARKADQDDSKHRLPAKCVNFSILMGVTAKGLVETLHKLGLLHWTERMCQSLLDDWYRAYPGALAYCHRKHAEARQYGYVRDWWGRRRYLPGVYSPHDDVREAALREAQAIPIQSGAQGYVKRWMARVWHEVLVPLRRHGYIEPWLQIHDDLVLELDEVMWDAVDPLMHATLPGGLGVPIAVDGKRGTKWSEVS